MKGRPYIAIGCDQQGQVTPTALQRALDPDFEPWHLPHFAPVLTERLLDARQQELVIAGRSLPDLLLSTGALMGPYRRTHPITRWTIAARRFTRALLAFLAADKPDLSRTK
jgi:hypothetical protein